MQSVHPFILAVSWCALAVLPAHAGRPVEPGELPTRRASLAAAVFPPPGDLFAAASAAAAPEIATAPVPQEAPPPVVAETPAQPLRPPPSQSLTMNLINRLVERGVLTKDDSSELMRQAEADVAEAKTQAAAEQQILVQTAIDQTLAAAQASGFTAPEPLPSAEDSVRVTYIPENVRAQMREEIRADVMARAKAENWASPRLIPDWVSRFRFFGDVRVRYEGDFFQDGNDNTGAFPNFNAINTGSPFDVSGTVFSPQLNVDQDRHRARLRARLGVEANLDGGFTAGIRIATGENNSPVSTNQSLGLANQGQGGNFSKYAIFLDRGFLKWQAGDAKRGASITAGRFENPFYSTDIIFDDDLGFDGLALQAKYEVIPGFSPFLSGGAFPVFNTDFNFSTNQPTKFESTDKWLYGGQLGVDWKINKDFALKIAGAYYHFDDVEGELSDPFTPLTAQDSGNTDNTRPSFAQKGNTYRPLRRIVPNALNGFGTTNQFQYFGLATPFHELALTGRFDVNRWEPFQITLSGEWVKNLAFDSQDIDRIAVNNRGPNSTLGGIGNFAGGDIAWIASLRAGSAALQKLGNWQAGVNYRHVESDAVVDAFADSDFGLGGTNLEGYTLFGVVALGPRTSVGLRWMSAQEIAGPPLRVDILQLDFSGKF